MLVRVEVLYYYDTLDTEGDYPNMAIPSKNELRRPILEIVDGAKEAVLTVQTGYRGEGH